MGYKMKGSPAKLGTIQGTAGHSSALKMKAEADAASALKYAKVKEPTSPPEAAPEVKNPKMPDADWKKGQESAKSSGRDLDALVKQRGGLKKGSDEYNIVQNQINKALGSKKRHGQTTVDTDTKGRKTSEVTTTPGISTKKKTVKKRKSGEVKREIIEYDRDSGKDKSVDIKYRKGGARKSSKVISKNLKTTKGDTDKVTKVKHYKSGEKKRSKVTFKTDVDKDKKVDRRGRKIVKYDKSGEVKKSKEVVRAGGRRTVTKTKDGVTTTKSKRTIGGWLTGKGKKE